MAIQSILACILQCAFKSKSVSVLIFDVLIISSDYSL